MFTKAGEQRIDASIHGITGFTPQIRIAAGYPIQFVEAWDTIIRPSGSPQCHMAGIIELHKHRQLPNPPRLNNRVAVAADRRYDRYTSVQRRPPGTQQYSAERPPCAVDEYF